MRPIDADAFKDYIRNALEETKHMYKDNGEWAKEITESFCKDIDEQPTIQPEPYWILCSERLPEEDVYVLCQTVSGARLVASYRLLNPWHKEKGWITSEFNRLSKEMIEAWMPLPEPYKWVTK